MTAKKYSFVFLCELCAFARETVFIRMSVAGQEEQPSKLILRLTNLTLSMK